MTQQQTKVLAFITKYHEKHGVVPTTLTTAKKFKVSKQAISRVYQALVAQKKLNKYAKLSYFELPTGTH